MIFFLTESPYSFNSTGAAALSSSHLRMISSLGLFQDITVVYINKGDEFWIEKPDGIMQSNILVKNIYIKEYGSFKKMNFRFVFRQLLKWNDLENLSLMTYDYKSCGQLLSQLQETIQTKKPTYLWAEHLEPLLLLKQLDTGKSKIIYSHHDFLFKLLKIRRGILKDRIRSIFMKRLELLSIRYIDFFVSGSLAEIKFTKRIMQNSCQVFSPCIYPERNSVKGFSSIDNKTVRIVHFGTIAATANKLGLDNLFKNILPAINHLDFELHFVGNVKEYILKIFSEQLGQLKIFFHGFVENLDDFFQPFDIHIIPYKGVSGTRTRVGSIIRYRPCIVGYENLLDSYPFLVNKKNSLIAKTDQEIINLLKLAICDKNLRTNIANIVQVEMENFEQKLKENMSGMFLPNKII